MYNVGESQELKVMYKYPPIDLSGNLGATQRHELHTKIVQNRSFLLTLLERTFRTLNQIFRAIRNQSTDPFPQLQSARTCITNPIVAAAVLQLPAIIHQRSFPSEPQSSIYATHKGGAAYINAACATHTWKFGLVFLNWPAKNRRE